MRHAGVRKALRLDTSWAGGEGRGTPFRRHGAKGTHCGSVEGAQRLAQQTRRRRQATAEIPSDPYGDEAAGALGSAADQKQIYEERGARRLGERARRREVSTRGGCRARMGRAMCERPWMKRRVRERQRRRCPTRRTLGGSDGWYGHAGFAYCCDDMFCRV